MLEMATYVIGDIINSLVSILPGMCPQLRTRIFHFVLS